MRRRHTMWIGLAISAATFQTLRNALARSMAGEVSPWLNSWARFTFNLPFAALTVLVLVGVYGLPALDRHFFFWCLLTAVTQLLANVVLIFAFRLSNFAQSIVLHKLETVFAALLGIAFFSERPSVWGWAGILVCGAGILLINLGKPTADSGWKRAFRMDSGALLAIASGFLLVLTSFYLKRAAQMVVNANPSLSVGSFSASAWTLFHTLWIEVAILSLYLALTSPREFGRVPRHWGRMVPMGMAAFGASLCWFWAYTLSLVAYVKAVGQFEAVLSVLVGIMIFREREAFGQIPGMMLVGAGILMVVVR